MTPASAPGGADPGAFDAACAVLGDLGRRNAPLGALTTYRVGGPAAVLARVRRPQDLQVVAAARRASALPVTVVGLGSNLLVADAGFDGIAVILDPAPDAFGSIGVDGVEMRAGAAVPLPVLARRSAEAALTGFEWAVGVPGSVGGAVRMNAGGHGSDMAAVLLRCRLADLAGTGDLVTVPVHCLGLGYRASALTPQQVVVDADLGLAAGDADTSRVTIREIVRWRREHQPGGQNAGSVFVNPTGDGQSRSAGWYIDAAGLRGHRLRSAQVSPKHANFIQADPGGSADDIVRLISLVAGVVAARYGVRLRTELRMVGFDTLNGPSTSSEGSP